MKKLFLAVAAVAMVFATSCKKENVNGAEEPVVAGDNEFICVIDQNANPQNAPAVEDGMGTMAHIDGDNNVWWQVGDKIKYIGQEVSSQGTSIGNPDTCSLICQQMTDNRAYFSHPTKHFGQGTHEAYYPSRLVTGGYYSSLDKKYISYKALPATINLEAGKNAGFLPMYGTGSGTHYITFTNICAVLKINIPDTINTCDQIVVSATEPINGGFTVSDTQPYKAQLKNDVGADTNKTITVNAPSTETFSGAVYVAIPEGTYTNFTVKLRKKTDSKDTHLIERTNKKQMTVNANKIYPVTLKPESEEIPANAFYFVAGANGATIALRKSGSPNVVNMYFFREGGTKWQKYTVGSSDDTINVPANDTLYFMTRSQTNAALALSTSAYHSFNISAGSADIGGNLMYLINDEGKDEGFSTSYAFCNLFLNQTRLIDISKLVFPDTISANCFYSTFEGCRNLTSSKIELNATVGAASCYYYMFKNCTTLVASTLTIGLTDFNKTTKICYGMFDGCSSLNPGSITLNATTCTASCYREMFKGCTSMNPSAITLPATTLNTSCYKDMFNGCTALACSVTINATSTLTGYKYSMENMFNGCSKLSSVSLPNCTTFDSGNVSNWLQGAGTSLTPSSGTQVGTVHCKGGVQSNVDTSLSSAGDSSHTWSSSADQ